MGCIPAPIRPGRSEMRTAAAGLPVPEITFAASTVRLRAPSAIASGSGVAVGQTGPHGSAWLWVCRGRDPVRSRATATGRNVRLIQAGKRLGRWLVRTSHRQNVCSTGKAVMLEASVPAVIAPVFTPISATSYASRDDGGG